jgi:ubiquitin carboxyl-terminal hydrolase 9/24
VLQDSLHQPQYVEKLEKVTAKLINVSLISVNTKAHFQVIRFIIKEKTLTLSDLDDIWAAQVGQHEAIVKNVHDLLAKLAWDFSPEQLDHLFDCFQRQLSEATTKQREKLLELIRRLAEDDKDGVMAEKVLTMFWNLAHNPDTGIDLMDQALAAHVKILDYSCTQYRESQKTRYDYADYILKALCNNDNFL